MSKPTVKITFKRAGKITSTCYLPDAQADRAIAVWKARSEDRSAVKESK